ncbi:MAG: ABC-F family ATP-binding cassette domain-containing protein [Bacteroidales bacterium]
MISINGLTVVFGAQVLFDNIDFHISDGEHVALVGKNGAGKSTILKLITSHQKPILGTIQISSNTEIGYLPQIMNYSKDKTIMEEALTAFYEITTLRNRFDVISEELTKRTDYESDSYSKLIIEYNDVNDHLNIFGTESIYLQAEKTLLGLGFHKEDFDKNRGSFSQGWNMRVELAKILLRKPSALLLDEPTNHLDIESIRWLESYLKTYSGSLLLISHDRSFLDGVTSRTIELMLGKVHDYKVSYTKYKVLRKERMAQQMAAYRNQQKLIEKTEDFISKFRYKATKSNQVQSRIKVLEKLDRIEVEEEDTKTLSIKFPPAPRSGDIVFRTKNLIGGYHNKDGDKKVFSGRDFVIERGEKIAFVGRNGEGKSTMMKILCEEIDALSGEVHKGHNVKLGYYAQNQEDVLNTNLTVYDTLEYVAVGNVRTKLRDILAAFLFREKDIDKKVAVLSGGERSRLAMARLMLFPYNILALDEPTNHMDMMSKDVMKQALINYDGTLIIVSHDRDFLTGLVDKVYEFTGGSIREYLGGMDDYLLNTQANFESSIGDTNALNIKKEDKSDVHVVSNKQVNILSFEEQKILRKKHKTLKNLEIKISDLEDKIKKTEQKLSKSNQDTDINSLTKEYHDLKKLLETTMSKWMELGEELGN